MIFRWLYRRRITNRYGRYLSAETLAAICKRPDMTEWWALKAFVHHLFPHYYISRADPNVLIRVKNDIGRAVHERVLPLTQFQRPPAPGDPD